MGRRLFFCLFSFKSCLFDLQCNGGVFQRKGIWSSILKRYTGATRGISLQNRLYAPQKCGIWKHSLQHGSQSSPNRRPMVRPQLLFPKASVTFLLNTRSHSKTAKLWRKPFSRQRIVFLVTLKIKQWSRRPLKEMQISHSTTKRRCEEMAVDVEEQLRKDIDACECFSLQFDESTDMVDVAQLCVFIRIVFEDMSTKEELLTILPLKGHTRGKEIFNAFMGFVCEIKLALFKLISITTDRAPAMLGPHQWVHCTVQRKWIFSGYPELSLCNSQASVVWKDFKYGRSDGYCDEDLYVQFGPGVCREGFSVLTWRRMMLSTQTCWSRFMEQLLKNQGLPEAFKTCGLPYKAGGPPVS